MKNQIPSLNGLRGISIIIVIISHFAIAYPNYNNLLKINYINIIFNTLQFGQLGVNIFFIISGYLITSLLVEEEVHSNKISLKNFYIKRIFRILPAYYFLLLIYFILQLFGWISINNLAWISTLTYTKNFNYGIEWYTGHTWSLSIEEQFYLIWPLIFTLGNNLRKIFTVAILILTPVLYTIAFEGPEYYQELIFYFRFDVLAIGCLFALYKNELINLVRPEIHKILFFIFSFTLIYLLNFNFLKDNLPFISQFISEPQIFKPSNLPFGIFSNILTGFLIFYSIHFPPKIWYHFLNSNILNFIGKLSYSIYLWQQLFIKNIAWIDSLMLKIPLIIISAIFSYYLIEKPFLKFRDQILLKSN